MLNDIFMWLSLVIIFDICFFGVLGCRHAAHSPPRPRRRSTYAPQSCRARAQNALNLSLAVVRVTKKR